MIITAAPELLHLSPNDIDIDINVRLDPRLDREFLSSIEEHGVLGSRPRGALRRPVQAPRAGGPVPHPGRPPGRPGLRAGVYAPSRAPTPTSAHSASSSKS